MSDRAFAFLETDRLSFSLLSADDAEFMLALLNDPDFLRNVGDRGARTVADARAYILRGPVTSYETFGYGLYRVSLKASETPIGICGLVKRESLPDTDIGFAFLPSARRQGYAEEAARAVLAYARDALHLARLVAIVKPDNRDSIRVLEKIGLRRETTVRLEDGGPELLLFSRDLSNEGA